MNEDLALRDIYIRHMQTLMNPDSCNTKVLWLATKDLNLEKEGTRRIPVSEPFNVADLLDVMEDLIKRYPEVRPIWITELVMRGLV